MLSSLHYLLSFTYFYRYIRLLILISIRLTICSNRTPNISYENILYYTQKLMPDFMLQKHEKVLVLFNNCLN